LFRGHTLSQSILSKYIEILQVKEDEDERRKEEMKNLGSSDEWERKYRKNKMNVTGHAALIRIRHKMNLGFDPD